MAPAVATILVVAMIVILAVVVGAYVLGTPGILQSSKIVGIAAKNSSSGITFTVQGGNDLGKVTALDVVQAGTTTNWKSSTPSPGDTYTTTSHSRPLSVVATFSDGTKQVLWMNEGSSTATATTTTTTTASLPAAGDLATITLTYVGNVGGEQDYDFHVISHGSRYSEITDTKWTYHCVGGGGLDGGTMPPDLAIPVGEWTDYSPCGSELLTDFKIEAILDSGSSVTLIDQTFT